MKTPKPWDNDANQLLVLISEKRGILSWYREKDQRWYQAQVLVDLFDATELHLRWGGQIRTKGTGKVIHLCMVPPEKLRSIAQQICRRRIQHGYTLANLGNQSWLGH